MQDKWKIDLYSEGACVYAVDKDGNIREVVAWARNHLAAKAAFDYLRTRNPTERYSVRNRSWEIGIHPDPNPLHLVNERLGDMRVSDLRRWHVLTAKCEDCQRPVRVDRVWLERKTSADTSLSEIEQRLVCKICNTRDRVRLTVTKEPR